MERYTEDGYFTQYGAEQVAAEFRELQPQHAESVIVWQLTKGWAVIVQPGYRPCDSCNGTGWTDGDSECFDCMRGWVRIVQP